MYSCPWGATSAATAFLEPDSAPSSFFSATSVHSDFWLKSFISNFFLAFLVIPPAAVRPAVCLPGIPRDPLPFITTCTGCPRAVRVLWRSATGWYAAQTATTERKRVERIVQPGEL